MTSFLKSSKIGQNSIFLSFFFARIIEQFQQVISAYSVFVWPYVDNNLDNLGYHMHLRLILPMVSARGLIFVRYVANIKHYWRHQVVLTCILRFDNFN